MAPTIPQYQDQQQAVRPEALPGVKVMTDAPAEAFNAGQSAQTLTNATEGALGEVEKVAEQQKYLADQAVHLDADTKAAKLQTDVQMRVSSLHGNDAAQAPDVAQDMWSTGLAEIEKGLTNSSQKAAFARSSTARSEELYKYSLIHATNETNNYRNQLDQDAIAQNRNNAVLNSGDLETVNNNADRVYAVVEMQAKRLGVPEDSPVFDQMVTQALSPLHRDVAVAQLDAGLTSQAQKYFADNKDEMSADDIHHVQSAIENQDVISEGNQLFNDLQSTKGLRFYDGTYNMEKVRAFVEDEASDLSDKKKEKMVDFVARRAGEFNTNKIKVDQERDHSFMNELYQMRKQGIPLAQAEARLLQKYATADSVDEATKRAAIGKVYGPPSESDPQTFINLWQNVYDGSAQRQDIDQALKSNKINESDWRSLREMDYKAKQDGTDPMTKNAWENVKMQALNSGLTSDKPAYAQFMYVMQHDAVNKSPDEIIKMAHDKLKDDPNTGVWSVFQSPQFKAQAQKLDANSIAFGTLNEQLGADQAQAIGSGASRSTGKRWGLTDVQKFADQFGGLAQIKKGTPVNNAVESLRKAGVPVNVHNVKQVLGRHPDGQWDGNNQ